MKAPSSSRLVRWWRVARGRWLLARGVRPASRRFGYDRGTPVHRHYLQQFLSAEADRIRGRCLEFHAPDYVPGYGGSRVTSLDILDVPPGSPRATLVADLTRPNALPAARFDCIVCTHVLHLVYEADAVVAELHRLLAPGGSLLVAVPGTQMRDFDWTEFRMFTALGLGRMLSGPFPEGAVRVRAYGNSLAAAAELRGLAAEDLRGSELAVSDPLFEVEVCAVATREPAV